MFTFECLEAAVHNLTMNMPNPNTPRPLPFQKRTSSGSTDASNETSSSKAQQVVFRPSAPHFFAHTFSHTTNKQQQQQTILLFDSPCLETDDNEPVVSAAVVSELAAVKSGVPDVVAPAVAVCCWLESWASISSTGRSFCGRLTHTNPHTPSAHKQIKSNTRYDEIRTNNQTASQTNVCKHTTNTQRWATLALHAHICNEDCT